MEKLNRTSTTNFSYKTLCYIFFGTPCKKDNKSKRRKVKKTTGKKTKSPLLSIVSHCCPLFSIVIHCCPLLCIVIHFWWLAPKINWPDRKFVGGTGHQVWISRGQFLGESERLTGEQVGLSWAPRPQLDTGPFFSLLFLFNHDICTFWNVSYFALCSIDPGFEMTKSHQTAASQNLNLALLFPLMTWWTQNWDQFGPTAAQWW